MQKATKQNFHIVQHNVAGSLPKTTDLHDKINYLKQLKKLSQLNTITQLSCKVLS